MVDLVATLLPYKVLASHVLLVFLFLALLSHRSWGEQTMRLLGRFALPLAFLISVGAVVGSLFYSGAMGYEPCILCLWQRILAVPLVIIFGIALIKKLDSAFTYAVPVVVLSAIIAAYQYYSTSLGGVDLLPCTADGGDCSKNFVLALGYITIPLMSLTISLYILLLAWAHKLYAHSNS